MITQREYEALDERAKDFVDVAGMDASEAGNVAEMWLEEAKAKRRVQNEVEEPLEGEE